MFLKSSYNYAKMRLPRKSSRFVFVLFLAIVVILWSIVTLHGALVQTSSYGERAAHTSSSHSSSHHVAISGNITGLLQKLNSALQVISAIAVEVEAQSKESVAEMSAVLESYSNKAKDVVEMESKITCNVSINGQSKVTYPQERLVLNGPLHGLPLIVLARQADTEVHATFEYIDKVVQLLRNIQDRDSADSPKSFRLVIAHETWSDSIAQSLLRYPPSIAAHIVYQDPTNDTFEWWTVKTVSRATNAVTAGAVVLLDRTTNITLRAMRYYYQAARAIRAESSDISCAGGSPQRCHGVFSLTSLHRTETVPTYRGLVLSTLWVSDLDAVTGKSKGQRIEDWLQQRAQRGMRECVYACFGATGAGEDKDEVWDSLFDTVAKATYDANLKAAIKENEGASRRPYTTIRELQEMMQAEGVLETLQNGFPMYSYIGVSILHQKTKNGTGVNTTASTSEVRKYFINKLRYAFGS